MPQCALYPVVPSASVSIVYRHEESSRYLLTFLYILSGSLVLAADMQTVTGPFLQASVNTETKNIVSVFLK